MAIDLLNSFLQRKQNITSNQKGTTSQTIQTMKSGQNLPQNLQVMRAIRALQAGQTIQGEIVSVKGNEVRLAILNDVIIDAKLAQTMNLAAGVTMPFQVKANNSQGLSLIPLFTNIAADPNVLKALDMAKLPVNDRSLEMVQTLMEKGMPIDKQSLQEMYREVVGFKDVPVKDIISLHQLEIPVSRENLTQLSYYQNNQHYLKDTFADMGNAIGNHLESMVAEGNTEGALKLINDLQQLFQKESGQLQSVATDKNMLEGNLTETAKKQDTVLLQDGESKVLGSESQGKTTTIVFTEDMLLKGDSTGNSSEVFQGKEATRIPAETNPIENKNQGILPEEQAAKEQLTKEEVLESAEAKSHRPQTQSIKESVDWQTLTESLLKEKNSGKISAFFEKIWDKEVGKQWLLEPEMITEKKNVKEYFEKLSSQIKELEKLFEGGDSGKNPVAKAIQNTASNLDFMNQLNQMHAYIQLPLKMANQNAHGELYVFTNKKNLTKQEGKVTALLHLDMEYLGKMDVYVAMENKNVSTNFYLEKEEYLDFLEGHMDMLTKRLEKRGYHCDIKATLRNGEEEESVMQTIQKQQGMSQLLSMQAFDVRA